MSSLPGRRILTISQLTRQLRQGLEQQFANIWVEGEISNHSVSAGGHSYFTLKDHDSQLSVVIFKAKRRYLQFRPREGMQVIAHGSITVYEKRGVYQLLADYLEPKGLGSLQLAFEQLKQRLQAEGLFAAEHKKPLPFLVSTLGIVTSAGGAALQDILNIACRRFPNLRVIISPATVQGAQAAGQIARALEKLNRIPEVQVIILARGGGSLEDLWAFNQEEVARAIFQSDKPIVSAVGHEIDFTIADFVADLRAPTPSAAAELVIRDKQQLVSQLRLARDRLRRASRQLLERYRQQLLRLAQSRCFRRGQSILLQQQQQTVDEMKSTLWRSYCSLLEDKKGRLQNLSARLAALSPLQVLKRGYSICHKLPHHELVKSCAQLQLGESVEVTLCQGKITCEVQQIKEG